MFSKQLTDSNVQCLRQRLDSCSRRRNRTAHDWRFYARPLPSAAFYVSIADSIPAEMSPNRAKFLEPVTLSKSIRANHFLGDLVTRNNGLVSAYNR